MFLSMWHLFRLLQSGKVISVTDCGQENVETGKEKLITWDFCPPVMSGMDFRELFLVDDRVRGRKSRLCLKLVASIGCTSRSAVEGGKFI